jgi:C4-dicarboxylate-specific signal transduction histidine kinase
MSRFFAHSLQHFSALDEHPKPSFLGVRLWETIWRYGLAACFVALAAFLALLLRLFNVEGDNYFGFYAAIAASVWFVGAGPGCMSIILATLAVEFFFTAPLYSLRINAGELPGFVFFIFCAAASLALSARLRQMERALRQAHDGLETTIRQRTAELQAMNAALTTEIADRERADHERELSAAALQDAQAQLARVLRMATLTECAEIAHEVNQPLTAIVANAGASQRFLSHDPPAIEEVRAAIGAIAADGARASGIIARISGLLRNRKPQLGPVDLNGTIREVLDLVRDRTMRFDVQVHTDLSPSLPLVVGDAIQLQQVLLNLITNAIEAMAASVEAERNLLLSTRLDPAAGMVEVSVEDSGIGLGEVDEARLFEGFYTTKSDGLGLGLSITQSIVQAHGGRLWVSSAQHRGVIFRFTLPTADSLRQ